MVLEEVLKFASENWDVLHLSVVCYLDTAMKLPYVPCCEDQGGLFGPKEIYEKDAFGHSKLSEHIGRD
ncbi:hypothetical protein HNV12_04350 [Methanococcoides sp. SA1]|nr:hypothetical protein [Methanococcoides sp. SA1]